MQGFDEDSFHLSSELKVVPRKYKSHAKSCSKKDL
jgi:hypothetical protein